MNGLFVFSPRTSPLWPGLFLVVACLLSNSLLAQTRPEPLIYLSSGAVRQGYIYKPAGKGPYPVMVFNQSMLKPCVEQGDPTPYLSLARFYNEHGWALFLPGRPQLLDMLDQKSTLTEKKKFMAIMEAHADNIGAAIVALKSQAFTDPNRVFVSGHAAGAVSSLLLARKSPGVRGIIVFSPAVTSWRENELVRQALTDAVRNATVPIFFIQPRNDTELQPIENLGPELERKGPPNRSKIYGPIGASAAEATAFAYNAPRVWGDDVFSFIKAAMAEPN